MVQCEGCCWAATFGLAALAKIKESVVSQQSRKDLQSGARVGFGDANPLWGGGRRGADPIKHISIWAVGLLERRINF